MSKAKSRKKKKELVARKAQSGQALLRNGKKAFDQQDYDKAIETWERGYKKSPAPELKIALAEAHFRRGMLSGNVEDVQMAAQYTPDDTRIAYHIGNIHQQRGAHEEALSCYQTVMNDEKADPALITQAAYAICSQTDDETAWAKLTTEQQGLLTHAKQLQRRPYTVTDDTPTLYKAFMAYDEVRFDEADQLFTAALADVPSKQAEGIIQQYLGNIAVQKDKLLVGLVHWQQAHQLGVNDPIFLTNLTEMYTRMAEDALSQQQTKRARQLANEGMRVSPDDKRLKMLVGHLSEWDGLDAANKGEWQEAEAIWHNTELDNGANFRLLYNLAIVREKMNEPRIAAETWRNALKRRPRKADNPDSLKPEQTAQLWQRVADNYVKAGQFDEALKVYQTAIKHDGNNLPLRQAYAEGLMTEGRLQAAENEFGRILERNADYIPALLRLGELLTESYYYWNHEHALRPWKRILELEPNHAEVRELIAEHYVEKARNGMGWHSPSVVLRDIEMGLSYAPDSYELRYLRAEYAMNMGELEDVPELMKNVAEVAQEIEEYVSICGVLLVCDFEDDAWEIIGRAREKTEIPIVTYAMIGVTCYINEGSQYGKRWLDYALAHQDEAPELDMLPSIIEMLLVGTNAIDVAREYMAIAAENKAYKAHLATFSGIIAAKEGDTKQAEKLFNKAERMARKDKNEGLLDKIEMLRMRYVSPFGGLMERMLENGMSPDDLGAVLGMLDSMDEGDFF